ncbi:hypothetical protein NL676_016672 [Syzygium grande]|nr:hypothetical protein NL676_016672 [Syzygium grande]
MFRWGRARGIKEMVGAGWSGEGKVGLGLFFIPPSMWAPPPGRWAAEICPGGGWGPIWTGLCARSRCTVFALDRRDTEKLARFGSPPAPAGGFQIRSDFIPLIGRQVDGGWPDGGKGSKARLPILTSSLAPDPRPSAHRVKVKAIPKSLPLLCGRSHRPYSGNDPLLANAIASRLPRPVIAISPETNRGCPEENSPGGPSVKEDRVALTVGHSTGATGILGRLNRRTLESPNPPNSMAGRASTAEGFFSDLAASTASSSPLASMDSEAVPNRKGPPFLLTLASSLQPFTPSSRFR